MSSDSIVYIIQNMLAVIMRPFSLGGDRILRRTLSVCLSVCLSVRLVIGHRSFSILDVRSQDVLK